LFAYNRDDVIEGEMLLLEFVLVREDDRAGVVLLEKIACLVHVWRSPGEPRARLGLACFGKKLHRPFAKTRARERQHLCFPARIANDGNFLKIVTVAEEKVRIAPRLVAFPTGEVFQQHEKLNGSGTSDFFHELGLHRIEFGFSQLTADAQDEKAIMLFEIRTHGMCLIIDSWNPLIFSDGEKPLTNRPILSFSRSSAQGSIQWSHLTDNN
jgi:hypothetical protein